MLYTDTRNTYDVTHSISVTFRCRSKRRYQRFSQEIKGLLDGVYLFVLGFYGPVNNEVMSSRSVNSGTVPGQA